MIVLSLTLEWPIIFEFADGWMDGSGVLSCNEGNVCLLCRRPLYFRIAAKIVPAVPIRCH
jgi:hypothetical protein